MIPMKRTRPVRGYLMLVAIVFGSIFVTVLGALTGFVLTENRAQSTATAASRGLAIAEAGLEYYRWYLAHYPGDLQNGTGVAGPYTIPYNDPEGGETGTIELAITGNTSCETLTSVDISSTGTPAEDPLVSRTITTRYARPTVARYSYILNDSVWAGADRIILGPYHSNGGIRMDGTINSPVTSSLSTWLCTSSFGCSPNQTKEGVWGAGTNPDLWNYPVPQVDFGAISADLASLKTKSVTAGRYLPRFSQTNNTNAASYWHGYHLVFNAGGTVTVSRVTSAPALSSTHINPSDNSLPDRMLISNETFYSTITIPENCGLIFVEDNVWIEGVVDAKVTVVAANVTTTGIEPNAMLRGNLTYAQTDGSDGLTLIAQNNVLITPDSPFNMTLNGIFIAQGGAFGRNYYANATYDARGTLTILGTTVSNIRTGTKWCLNSSCTNSAGYQTRIDAYDRNLATDPPPFTPTTSTDYEFVDWREQ